MKGLKRDASKCSHDPTTMANRQPLPTLLAAENSAAEYKGDKRSFWKSKENVSCHKNGAAEVPTVAHHEPCLNTAYPTFSSAHWLYVIG